jgi:hypothetical protein
LGRTFSWFSHGPPNARRSATHVACTRSSSSSAGGVPKRLANAKSPQARRHDSAGDKGASRRAWRSRASAARMFSIHLRRSAADAGEAMTRIIASVSAVRDSGSRFDCQGLAACVLFTGGIGGSDSPDYFWHEARGPPPPPPRPVPVRPSPPANARSYPSGS